MYLKAFVLNEFFISRYIWNETYVGCSDEILQWNFISYGCTYVFLIIVDCFLLCFLLRLCYLITVSCVFWSRQIYLLSPIRIFVSKKNLFLIDSNNVWYYVQEHKVLNWPIWNSFKGNCHGSQISSNLKNKGNLDYRLNSNINANKETKVFFERPKPVKFSWNFSIFKCGLIISSCNGKTVVRKHV